MLVRSVRGDRAGLIKTRGVSSRQPMGPSRVALRTSCPLPCSVVAHTRVWWRRQPLWDGLWRRPRAVCGALSPSRSHTTQTRVRLQWKRRTDVQPYHLTKVRVHRVLVCAFASAREWGG